MIDSAGIMALQTARYARRYGIDIVNPRRLAALRAFLQPKQLNVAELSQLALGTTARVRVYDPFSGQPHGVVAEKKWNCAATRPLLLPVADFADYLDIRYRENPGGRGSGPSTDVLTRTLDDSKEAIGVFVGFDRDRDSVVFVPNNSIGLNLLVGLAARDRNNHFVISRVAHHSASLPARETGRGEYFNTNPDGTYDLNDLESRVARLTAAGKRAVIIIESESNVTGYKFPVETVCLLAHKYRALVFLDHGQGVAGKRINLRSLAGEVWTSFSGHKVYARDGSGAVVGPKWLFAGGALMPAGGTISAVSEARVYYANDAHAQEPGTPGYIAQASLAKALLVLLRAGMTKVESYEEGLTRLMMARLLEVEGLAIVGESDISKVPRGPVVSFIFTDTTGKRIPPGFVAAALSYFQGVGSRPGQFCSHLYVYGLLGASTAEIESHARLHAAKGRAGCAALPGDEKFHVTRFSIGMTTDPAELEEIPGMLTQVRYLWGNRARLALKLDREEGRFYLPGAEETGESLLERTGPYSQ